MDALSWAAIGAVVAVITLSLTFAKFWMALSSRITEAKLTADTAKSKVEQLERDAKAEAESAGLRAVQANLKIDNLSTELSKFELHAEREFVNHDDLRQLSERHEAQFTDLRSDLKGITQRLDRLLENRFPPINA